MGWQVHVHEYVARVAVCNEPGCGWSGTKDADQAVAEEEVAHHRDVHDRLWAEKNVEWGDDPKDWPILAGERGRPLASPQHEHYMARTRTPSSPVEAVPFACVVEGCTFVTHPSICIDEDGKVECVCGLDDERARAVE